MIKILYASDYIMQLIVCSFKKMFAFAYYIIICESSQEDILNFNTFAISFDNRPDGLVRDALN